MKFSDPIGGFFGLEGFNVKQKPQDIYLSTGRNAFEYILLACEYRKIYMPYYLCDVLMEPLSRLNINHEFYSIDANLEPIFDFSIVKKSEAFLYINYFGVKDGYCNKIKKFPFVIIDNTQAYFSKVREVDFFNSWRKFFGVFDGATFSCKRKLENNFPKRNLIPESSFLFFRVEGDLAEGYQNFKKCELDHNKQNISTVTDLSFTIYNKVDFEMVERIRNKNFFYLDQYFSSTNKLKLDFNGNEAPMNYPLLLNDGHVLRSKLIKNNVFVPQYWLGCYSDFVNDPIGYELKNNLIALPIDQRYSINDMNRIIELVSKYGE